MKAKTIREMYLEKKRLLLCVALVILLTRSEAEGSSNKKAETRSDCDHILPLMMMLGAPPTAKLPSVWLLGMLSLGAAVLFGSAGVGDVFWGRRAQEEEENGGESEEEEECVLSH